MTQSNAQTAVLETAIPKPAMAIKQGELGKPMFKVQVAKPAQAPPAKKHSAVVAAIPQLA
jgi:hypothetical protein